jgi:exonuclease III
MLALGARKRPKRPDPPHVKLATYNIRNGNNSKLFMACEALHEANIDIAILTETKIPDEIYAHSCEEYDILCTKALSRHGTP